MKPKRTEVITSNVQNDDVQNPLSKPIVPMKNSKSDIVIDLTEQISTDDKLDAEITEEELIQVVNKTKPNKAPGPEGISIDCVKPKHFEFFPLLFQLFNSIFSQEIIQESWRFSLLKPLYKNKETRKIQTIPEDLHSATVFLKFSHQFYKPDYVS